MKKFTITLCLMAISFFALAQMVRETGTFEACGTTWSYAVHIDWHGDSDAFYNDWADHVDALQAKANANCNASLITIAY